MLNMDYFLHGYFNLEKSFDNLNLKPTSVCYSTGKVTSSLSHAPCQHLYRWMTLGLMRAMIINEVMADIATG